MLQERYPLVLEVLPDPSIDFRNLGTVCGKIFEQDCRYCYQRRAIILSWMLSAPRVVCISGCTTVCLHVGAMRIYRTYYEAANWKLTRCCLHLSIMINCNTLQGFTTCHAVNCCRRCSFARSYGSPSFGLSWSIWWLRFVLHSICFGTTCDCRHSTNVETHIFYNDCKKYTFPSLCEPHLQD